jgi:hypothetical protein
MSDEPKIQIGDFIIQRISDHTFWIGREGGEGGVFHEDDFEDAIAVFYKDNF